MESDDPHISSSFQDFLREEGIEDEVNAAAIKHVLAWRIEPRCNSTRSSGRPPWAER
jgi:hypothetical protein